MTPRLDVAHQSYAAAPAADPLGMALAVLAHELRNPLSAIGLAANGLERHTKDDKRCEALLKAISSNVTLAARLVEDLMQHSKLHSGSFPLQRGRCSLRDHLEECIAIALQQMDQPGRPITLRMPAGAIHLDADRMRMQQVFVNLLTNALRYTPAPGYIEVSAAEAHGQVVVQVADDGIGIERERLATLFDPVALPWLTGSRLGLGVGLGVVRKIVEMHGGSVQAHSDGAARGSRFTVRLPARP